MKRNQPCLAFFFVLICLAAFPVYADLGSSSSYKIGIDTVATSEIGNSSSYKADVSSGISGEYNSSSYKIAMGIPATTSLPAVNASNASYQIYIPPNNGTVIGGPSGGTNNPIVPINKTIIPPQIIVIGNVSEFMISNAPVLVELYPLDAFTIPLSISNPLNTTIFNISVSVKDIPSEWYSYDNRTFDIAPGQTVSMAINFRIPANAEIGNHLATIVIQNNEIRKETSYILRINYREAAQPASIYESARVNELDNTTIVNIRVVNKEDVERTLYVLVKIDKSVAKNTSEIVFITSPSKIIQADPVVEFELLNMKPGEERTITYFVRKVIVDISPFFYSSIQLIRFMELPSPPGHAFVIDEKYVYAGAVLLVAIFSVIIGILVTRHFHRRKRIRHHLREAKRAVERIRHHRH